MRLSLWGRRPNGRLSNEMNAFTDFVGQSLEPGDIVVGLDHPHAVGVVASTLSYMQVHWVESTTGPGVLASEPTTYYQPQRLTRVMMRAPFYESRGFSLSLRRKIDQLRIDYTHV